MSLDDKLWSCCLEADTTLDANDGIADIAVTANGIAGTNLFDLLDSLDLIVEVLAIDSIDFSFLKCNLQSLGWLLGCDMLEVSFLRQTLCRVEKLATTDGCSPKSYIIRILKFGEVGIESMLIEVINLLLTAQCLVTSHGYYLLTRRKDLECHIETNLVVTGSGTSVSNGIGSNLIGIAGNGDSLEDTLRRNGDWIAVITEDIAKDHELQRLLIVLLSNIKGDILLSAELICILLILLQLLWAEATGVCRCCINFPAILAELHHCVTCIKTATVGDNNFLCHSFIPFRQFSLFSLSPPG